MNLGKEIWNKENSKSNHKKFIKIKKYLQQRNPEMMYNKVKNKMKDNSNRMAKNSNRMMRKNKINR